MGTTLSGTKPERPDVWRAAAGLVMILGTAAIVVWALDSALGLAPTGQLRSLINLALIAAPVLTWGLLFYLPEKRSATPRPMLPAVVILSGLAASGLGIPLIESFATESWLPSASGSTRLIAYTLIVGFTDEFLKYAAVRYTVFPHRIRNRADAVAYGIAAGIGYSAVINLNAAFGRGGFEPGPGAFRLFGEALIQAAFGAVAAYFMAAATDRNCPIWRLPAGIGMAAALHGATITARAGVVLSRVGIGGTGNAPLLGLGFELAVTFVTFTALSFLTTRVEASGVILEDENAPSPPSTSPEPARLSRTQLWSSWLAIGATIMALLAGMWMHGRQLKRMALYEDPAAGISAYYPAGWLLDTEGDYVFRVRDPAAAPFNTTLQVSVIPVGPDATARNVLDSITLRRSLSLSAYRVLGVEPVEYPTGEAALMRYVYVSEEINPFLESHPVVVMGEDAVFLKGDQAIVVTYRAWADGFERQRFRFEQFLANLEF